MLIPEGKENIVLDKLKDDVFVLGCDVDVDGLTSAVLFRTVYKPKVTIPIYDFGVTEQEHIPDIIFDMTPREPWYSGIVVDHHPLSREIALDNRYALKLIWRPYPTNKIVWSILKDKIPKDRWWIVLVGCAGEGQLEQVPVEVWDYLWRYNREVFADVVTVSTNYYSKTQYNVYPIPAVIMMSSGLNALSRIGKAIDAITILENAERPMDIYRNKLLRSAKRDFDNAVSDAIKDAVRGLDLGYVFLYEVSSPYKIESTIAFKLQENMMGKTVIVVNSHTGKLSGRGGLVEWIASKCNSRREWVDQGFTMGGHAGFMGGSLGGVSVDEFINGLIELDVL